VNNLTMFEEFNGCTIAERRQVREPTDMMN